MFWIFISLLLIIATIVLAKDTEFFSLLGLLFLAVTLIPLFTGIAVYPELAGDKAKIISLKQEIELLRSAHYTIESGELVGGSLDNFKQSTVLSEYLENYAYRKSEYNRELTEAKLHKQLFLFRMFGDGYFISKKVLELEILE